MDPLAASLPPPSHPASATNIPSASPPPSAHPPSAMDSSATRPPAATPAMDNSAAPAATKVKKTLTDLPVELLHKIGNETKSVFTGEDADFCMECGHPTPEGLNTQDYYDQHYHGYTSPDHGRDPAEPPASFREERREYRTQKYARFQPQPEFVQPPAPQNSSYHPCSPTVTHKLYSSVCCEKIGRVHQYYSGGLRALKCLVLVNKHFNVVFGKLLFEHFTVVNGEENCRAVENRIHSALSGEQATFFERDNISTLIFHLSLTHADGASEFTNLMDDFFRTLSKLTTLKVIRFSILPFSAKDIHERTLVKPEEIWDLASKSCEKYRDELSSLNIKELAISIYCSFALHPFTSITKLALLEIDVRSPRDRRVTQDMFFDVFGHAVGKCESLVEFELDHSNNWKQFEWDIFVQVAPQLKSLHIVGKPNQYYTCSEPVDTRPPGTYRSGVNSRDFRRIVKTFKNLTSFAVPHAFDSGLFLLNRDAFFQPAGGVDDDYDSDREYEPLTRSMGFQPERNGSVDDVAQANVAALASMGVGQDVIAMAEQPQPVYDHRGLLYHWRIDWEAERHQIPPEAETGSDFKELSYADQIISKKYRDALTKAGEMMALANPNLKELIFCKARKPDRRLPCSSDCVRDYRIALEPLEVSADGDSNAEKQKFQRAKEPIISHTYLMPRSTDGLLPYGRDKLMRETSQRRRLWLHGADVFVGHMNV